MKITERLSREKSRRFWEPGQLAQIPLLMALRDEVLRRNPRRCPKWGFRLGDDLAVQLQPRPTFAEGPDPAKQELFLGAAALDPEGVTRSVFRDGTEAIPEGPGCAWIKFKIVRGDKPDRWE